MAVIGLLYLAFEDFVLADFQAGGKGSAKKSGVAVGRILAGTQVRKSLGFAEASIIIDNQKGKLPIEYGEVVITRRLYRNGESGYYINKTPCRLKDVLELFMDTGIGKDRLFNSWTR